MEGELASNFLFCNPGGEFLVVITGGPDLAQEVRRVDVSMVFEETAVAAAAEHQIRIEFAADFAAGLGEDAWQVGHAFQFVAEGRDVVAGEDLIAGRTFLHGPEMIAADGGDDQGRCGRGFAVLAEILDEIEKFAGFVADADKKRQVAGLIVGFEIVVAALVNGHTAIK